MIIGANAAACTKGSQAEQYLWNTSISGAVVSNRMVFGRSSMGCLRLSVTYPNES